MTFPHPRFPALLAYAAEEISGDERARVARHLAACPRCRDRVRSARELRSALRDEPIPALPADTFERIVARREAGERAILPTEGAPARSVRVRRLLPLAAAAVFALLALGGSLLFRAGSLEAESSELRILSRAPRAGEEVRVEYRATPALAGEEELVVRARLFTAGPRMGMRHATVGRLLREDGRVFRGTLRLPDSVLYAALAVEDPRGRRVDLHPAEWEVMAHGADGRPLFAALERRMEYRGEWDTALALESARELTRLYPDSLGGWFHLYVRESGEAGRARADSLRAAYRERLRGFAGRAERGPRPAPEAMSRLVFFASALGDTATTRRWRERLLREHPSHPAGAQLRVFEAVEQSRGDFPALMAALERLWEEVGATSGQLAFTAFMSAQQKGDPAALLRWGRRLAEVDPATEAWVARVFSETPGLHAEAMERLRAQIRELDAADGTTRPLDRTVEAYRRGLRTSQGYFLGQLGRALVAEGRAREGLDTLARATGTGWNPALLRTLADTRLALGDTAGALPVLARVAADPGTRPAFADTARSRGGRTFDAGRWAAWVEAGRREMLAHVRSQAVDRGLRGRVRLTTLAGEEEVFRPESGGPTLFAFWSRHCPPSQMQLGELQRLSEELRRRGVRVVAVTEGEDAKSLGEFVRRAGYTFPVFLDGERDAQRAFDNRATPRYFVLDASGRIRFDNYSLEDVLRQVEALRAPAAEAGR